MNNLTYKEISLTPTDAKAMADGIYEALARKEIDSIILKPETVQMYHNIGDGRLLFDKVGVAGVTYEEDEQALFQRLRCLHKSKSEQLPKLVLKPKIHTQE